MYKVALLNKISPKGVNLFTDSYEKTEDFSEAAAVLVRSQDMHSMEFGPNLLSITRAGAGTNNIPIDACSAKGIVVFNTPGANANAVKELVLTAMLMSSRNVIDAVGWVNSLNFHVDNVEKNKARFAGEEVRGKTLAVVGLGYIGVMVANAAKDLGMTVVGYDPYISVQNAHDLSPSVRLYESLPALLPHCDFVTIHVPAMEQTKGMFNYEIIDAMKNKATLLNFSRDSLVVGADVKRALAEKKLRRYVTDFPTDELLDTDGAILIPHLGASTKESEENCAVMAVRQTMNYLEHGIIENSVNFPTTTPGPKSTVSRICVLNRNIPSMLGKITGVLAEMNVNISKLINKSNGDNAYTIIDVDNEINEAAIRKAFDFEGVISVRVL
ncbi:MAG: phosphoglycerate dehydrogenase [Clostridiales Family XIII bacterium]|jgi:D-3-phosphoglycerate dehydrogenase|nr:phosphoglycerate dehydrogenase [Clostridiales Family XIII bacterium]